MAGWLSMPTFISNIIPVEIRLTFLQLVIISLEIPDVFDYITDSLLDFTCKQIQWIFDEVDKKPGNSLLFLIIASGGCTQIDYRTEDALIRR